MMESCATKQIQHRVIRDADFHPPEYWEVQLDNVKRFPVQVDSKEYNEICILFDKTMTGQYMAIIRIERIQNKPWYMQYNSYRSFSPKKNTERRLFHGCPQQSAELIIHSFFNRSFAGINGTFTVLDIMERRTQFNLRDRLWSRCVFLSKCQVQSWICTGEHYDWRATYVRR